VGVGVVEDKAINPRAASSVFSGSAGEGEGDGRVYRGVGWVGGRRLGGSCGL
jgi:hypothetical protein